MGQKSVDSTSVTLLILGAICLFLIDHWVFRSRAKSVIRESAGEATLEKCPGCKAIVGVTATGLAVRLSQKDACPHCGVKIKR